MPGRGIYSRTQRPAGRLGHTPRSYRRDDEAQSLVAKAGLQFRTVSPATMGFWTALQVVGLIFQWHLWQEAKGNLDLYEHTLATQCRHGQVRHGVCTGPIWNVSAWDRFTLEGWGMSMSSTCIESRGGSFGHSYHRKHRHRHFLSGQRWKERCRLPNHTNHSFEFVTRSSPPTFLVAVDAVAMGSGVRPDTSSSQETTEEWESQGDEDDEGDSQLRAEEFSNWALHVERVAPPPLGARPHVEVVTGEAGVVTVEDESEEAALALAANGSVLWKVVVENRAHSRQKVEFEAFVEDVVSAFPGGFKSAHCSFVAAWKTFNQQHQGRRHGNAALSSFLLGLFLPLNAVAALAVFVARLRHLHLAKRDPERSTGCSFHCVVIAKFVVVDILQQICIVVYLLGWYEADGLRCQLCLFHPGRCEEASPFGFATVALLTCTVLSSLSSQLLGGLPDKVPGGLDIKQEDCGHTFARILAASVAVLPLTTGSFFSGQSLFISPTAVHVVLVVPCVLGWMTVAMLLLLCMLNCCEDSH